MRLWIIAASLVGLVVGSVVGAKAQGTPFEGLFVQAPDGVVWAVADGQRWRIAAVPITADELAALPLGGTAATLAQLPVQGAAAASPDTPATAAPSLTRPVAASPMDGLVGQTVSLPRGSGNIDIQVERAVWWDTKSTGGTSTKYVFLRLKLTNRASERVSLGVKGDLGLQDELGKVYPMLGDYDQRDLYNALSNVVSSPYNPISPGESISVALAFGPVPISVQSLTLVRL